MSRGNFVRKFFLITLANCRHRLVPSGRLLFLIVLIIFGRGNAGKHTGTSRHAPATTELGAKVAGCAGIKVSTGIAQPGAASGDRFSSPVADFQLWEPKIENSDLIGCRAVFCEFRISSFEFRFSARVA